MTPIFIFSILIGYFLVLIGISYFTSRGADNDSFYLGNKQSPWYLVAFGMIGASLSGITFISIPGWVGESAKQFGYMQMVFGYLVGYMVIAYVLLPLYYKMNVTSIYTYLAKRFGVEAHKIGAVYFLLSRITGASIRLLLVANVLQEFVFNDFGIPFAVTVLISILLIWVYTYKGGIKTIIWTDTLQTLFMLLSLGFTFWFLSKELDFSQSGGMVQTIADSGYSKIFFFDDWKSGAHFSKMFLGGIFIAIGMTGLDQDMMQKNLSCKNLKAAQTNMVSFSIVLVFINLIFLALGALLYLYAAKEGIVVPEKSDLLFPEIALNSNLPIGVGVLFLLGLIAAAYSSADSALTSLTTSVCVDFLDTEDAKVSKKKRMTIHIIMSVVLFLTVLILNATLDESAIWQLIRLAGFTYGPLIGLFYFGILTKYKLRKQLIVLACLIPPVLSYFIDKNSVELFNGFKFGGSLIILNAIITFLCLFLISDGKVESKN
jgi:Na+/proline symporter